MRFIKVDCIITVALSMIISTLSAYTGDYAVIDWHI